MKLYIVLIGVLVLGLIAGGIYMNKQGITIQNLLSTNLLGIVSAVEWQVNTSVWEGSASNFNVAPQDPTPSDLFFKSDGTKMYVVGETNARVYSYSLLDFNSPQWSSNSTNSTLAGTLINHTVVWTDNIALSNFTFSFDNGTGTFSNDSSVSFIGKTNYTNVLKYANQSVGSTIRWQVWAWDSTGNNNGTSIFSYLTTSAGGENCWTNDTVNKLLIIPNGCVFQGSLGV